MALTTGLAATLATAVPAPASAAASAAASAGGWPTIQVSDSKVVLGTEVTVSGTSPHPLRWVVLQMKTADNGWQDVDRQLTGLDAVYELTAPGWHGTHRLRTVAPRTLLAREEISDTRTVKVTMGYPSRGRRSDWSWLTAPDARWDPCQRITYRINPSGGHRRATADIKAAFRTMGRVTGFEFTYLGRTTRRITRHQHGYHPADTDVLVDWQRPRQEKGLSGGTAGIGGHWVQDGRRFDGYVVLDQTERLKRSVWRQVVTHELGHVMGLGHARSPSQLMHGTSSSKNIRWGAGDLAGLRQVGPSRGCLG